MMLSSCRQDDKILSSWSSCTSLLGSKSCQTSWAHTILRAIPHHLSFLSMLGIRIIRRALFLITSPWACCRRLFDQHYQPLMSTVTVLLLSSLLHGAGFFLLGIQQPDTCISYCIWGPHTVSFNKWETAMIITSIWRSNSILPYNKINSLRHTEEKMNAQD